MVLCHPRLCGDESVSAQDMILRQQLNLQVFVPLGLALGILMSVAKSKRLMQS